MTDAAKQLSAQARNLSPSERLELVDDLLASLDEIDPKIDGLWAKEAEDRLAAYRRGELKAVPLETVAAIDRIRRFPEAWHPLGDEIRRCRLRRFPYGLIYSKEQEGILILAVAHAHREPGYWRDRK